MATYDARFTIDANNQMARVAYDVLEAAARLLREAGIDVGFEWADRRFGTTPNPDQEA